MPKEVERVIRMWSNPRTRRIVNVVSVLLALIVTALAARHFASTGWPFAHAEPVLLTCASLLFLSGYFFKAHGWRLLIAEHERPDTGALAAASGAACLTGIALPGRFDDAVRVVVLKRYPGTRAGVKTLALSLFTLGLVDTVALTPFASTAAATTGSLVVRITLAIVAFGGVGAAAVVIVMPRLGRSARLVRYRLTGWLAEHAPSTREATKGFWLVLASWLVRSAGLCLLLGALGIGLSFPLAIAFLTAGAASAALPVAPAGAATQVGAGAALLVASGVGASQAISFAIAAQTLVIMVAAVVVLGVTAWHFARRFAVARVAV
ncbi:MAG: lysylphosphatidylglycerol synthase domain-containing protein [Gaiellaceae bacterium]